jgi:hypothetical protein
MLTHSNCVADAKHLARFPDDDLTLGQQVAVSVVGAGEVLALCRCLV